MVSICIQGTSQPVADAAIEAGFGGVAEVHRLMSFHDSASDVSQLNRFACERDVSVDAQTMHVVRKALDFSASSSCFDITVAGCLVDTGFLPCPASSHVPDDSASWRDIELIDDSRIRFHRPLWIDLGGIAKGYAVDRALACMKLDPDVQVYINAGGDLRVAGPAAESILLRSPWTDAETLPVLTLQNGSIASSSGRDASRRQGGKHVGPHIHATRKRAMGRDTFVSVIAQECLIADALTKVVMAQGVRSDSVLRKFGATGYLCNSRNEWRSVGSGA
jgi:thiamine biosynthesis lipoprotein